MTAVMFRSFLRSNLQSSIHGSSSGIPCQSENLTNTLGNGVI